MGNNYPTPFIFTGPEPPFLLAVSLSLSFSVDGCNINEHILARMLVRLQANPVSLKSSLSPLFIADRASISLFNNHYKGWDRSFRDPQLEGEKNAALDSEVAGWEDGRYKQRNEDGCVLD